MNKELEFAKKLEVVRKLAKAQGNMLSKEQVEEAFGEIDITGAQLEPVFAYLKTKNIGIGEPMNIEEILTPEDKDYLTEYVESLKELPAFDNRGNVMNSLSTILADALQYNVSFSTVDEEESTVRRNISLSYSCANRSTALAILQKINDGKYPCLIKNCNISDSGSACSVSVELTYFEYK